MKEGRGGRKERTKKRRKRNRGQHHDLVCQSTFHPAMPPL